MSFSIVKDATIRSTISDEEWKTRVDLAACYRLMRLYGMTDLIYNHITARVPGTENEILINPYGMLYEEITASNLYKIDLDGNVLRKPDTEYGINLAGYVIHSAVHGGRHDAACVIHTHTRAAVAVSAMKCGLLPISQTSMRFHNRVSYHDFEGPAIDTDERKRLVADLGRNNVMMLRNHGTLVAGRSIPEAFNAIYALEMACKIQVDVMASGAQMLLAPEEMAERTAQLLSPRPEDNHAGMDGALEWPAMLRLLDRSDTSYAT